MRHYKLILADDEPPSREGLKFLLSKDNSITVVAACTNGLEAIQAIEMHNPEIVLLDIQMPEVNGFDVLRSLTTPIPQVVFITAFDQYAIKAFENHALDYLLKPFTDERFFKSLERAKEQVRLHHNQEAANKVHEILGQLNRDENDKVISSITTTKLQKLVVKTSGKILMVPWDEITHIAADDYVIRINYANKVAVVRESMKNMEQLLPSAHFIRVHKSYIVNVDKIIEIENNHSGGLALKLTDKSQIPVSKNYRILVAARLGIN
jgi:two-component system, LytTR family, response regulator